jgi:hypothetical protein
MKTENKIGMIGVISNPVQRLTSHNGGWTLVVKSILENKFNTEIDILTEKDDWNKYHALVINEGINYKFGSYNFFGGVSQQVFDKLDKFKQFKGDIYSTEDVDYNHLCNSRKELNNLSSNNYRIPEVIKMSHQSNKLILGDSHSVSVFKPKYCISRNDGKTLHGFLKNGIKSYVNDSIKELIFYAGNIDVRFHIGRQITPSNSIEDLCFKLENQLKELKIEKISLVGLIPIEAETRKIPKSGQYKGKNFFESRGERQFYVKHFNRCFKEICKRNNWKFLEWSFDYDEELSFDDMEARQSVHLRPTSYMFANEFIKQETNNELTLF